MDGRVLSDFIILKRIVWIHSKLTGGQGTLDVANKALILKSVHLIHMWATVCSGCILIRLCLLLSSSILNYCGKVFLRLSPVHEILFGLSLILLFLFNLVQDAVDGALDHIQKYAPRAQHHIVRDEIANKKVVGNEVRVAHRVHEVYAQRLQGVNVHDSVLLGACTDSLLCVQLLDGLSN